MNIDESGEQMTVEEIQDIKIVEQIVDDRLATPLFCFFCFKHGRYG